MFRISARDSHAWRDIAQNLGKLSLAGMFLTGTFLLVQAYADSAIPVTSNPYKVSTSISITPQNHNGH
jgi:hypothetical protein